MSENTRTKPNILICGTPGTGKTTTAELVCCLLPSYTQINIGDIVKLHNLHEGYDETRDTLILDEDKVLDYLEPIMVLGGIILDHHGCDLFPERWLDLVVVLQTDNTILYERLEKRGYSDAKIKENVECEIMQVVLEEAYDSYQEDIVRTLKSESLDQMEANVRNIGILIEELENQL